MKDLTGSPPKRGAPTAGNRSLRPLLAFVLTVVSLLVLPSVGRAEIITILAGDKDSLGTGVTVGDPVILGTAVATSADGAAFDQRRIGSADWGYAFTLPADQQIVGATLTMLTYDVEDGGLCDGWGPSACDVRLFLDGIEFAGAFDDASTPDLAAAGPIPVPANLVTFYLGPSFYSALGDGIFNVRLDSSSAPIVDHVWIDYAELQVETARVPEPSTLTLLFGGFAALAAARSRRLWRKPR